MKAILFLCIAVCSALRPAQAWEPPYFCRGSPCPEYAVINRTEAYETRQYTESEPLACLLCSLRPELAQHA